MATDDIEFLLRQGRAERTSSLSKARDIFQQRELKDDEYMKDGLIYCAICNTPRQALIEGYYVSMFCQCQREVKEREEAALRKQLIEEQRKKLISSPKLRACRFEVDDGETPNTKQICEKYVENFEKLKENGFGLFIFGDKGTGKTFYAYAIANALIDKGYKIRGVKLTSIIQRAQQFSEDFETAVAPFYEADLLIIDDLGKERSTPFAAEAVFNFLDGCYIRKVPLIVTTNKDIDEIEKIMNEPETAEEATYACIFDRVFEHCKKIRLNKVRRRERLAKHNEEIMNEILGIKKSN